VKLAYISLGCPKNVIDLETILGGLNGIEIVGDSHQADATIVNTCAFITSAKQESIDAIFDIVRIKQDMPGHKILVTGCLPQRYRDELARELPEVDAFFPFTDVQATIAGIRQFFPGHSCDTFRRKLITPSHYAYLRIAEGCDNRCSYCAIPLIKGAYKSRPKMAILTEAHELVESGVRELVLVAQDTTYYGREQGEKYGLANLLSALNEIPDLKWIRLMYTHPAHWDRSLIEAMAGLDKVVKYIDLPIQHVSDRLLRQMGRKVTRNRIESLIDELRSNIPELAFRTSLIVGFPGETDAEFAELLQFVSDARFERLGVFTYSHEEGTRAYETDDSVSEEIKLARQQEIMERQAEIAAQQSRALIGREVEIVIDETDKEEGKSFGRTQWDAPEIDNSVIIDKELSVGRFVKVKIIDADIFDLFAAPAESSRVISDYKAPQAVAANAATK